MKMHLRIVQIIQPVWNDHLLLVEVLVKQRERVKTKATRKKTQAVTNQKIQR